MQTIFRCGLALMFVAMHAQVLAQNDAAQKRPNAHFARLDTNKDGFLSYQEARADREVARHFALSDENRDGKLSEDEYLKLKATQARNRAGAHVSDGAITSKVKLALLRAKDLKSTEIHVETVAGMVRLIGEVDNAKQAARAAQLATRVKGVKTVENKLTVRLQRK